MSPANILLIFCMQDDCLCVNLQERESWDSPSFASPLSSYPPTDSGLAPAMASSSPSHCQTVSTNAIQETCILPVLYIYVCSNVNSRTSFSLDTGLILLLVADREY